MESMDIKEGGRVMFSIILLSLPLGFLVLWYFDERNRRKAFSIMASREAELRLRIMGTEKR
jgi:hypothetical protein